MSRGRSAMPRSTARCATWASMLRTLWNWPNERRSERTQNRPRGAASPFGKSGQSFIASCAMIDDVMIEARGMALKDWDAIVDVGMALPGVELATAYGKPALKLRGKVLAATTSPDPGSFVLRVAAEEKDILIETEPDTFWETDHYRGWPAILVRYGTAAGDRVAILFARAWWDRATSAQRKSFGERP